MVGWCELHEYSSNYAKAIAYYEKAYNLAEMEENLDEALESAQLALRYSPKELKQFPLAALGWVYFKRRDFTNAVDFLTKSADLGPTATNLMHLGMALLESGQKDRARAVFRKAKTFKTKGAGLEEKILEQFLERVNFHEAQFFPIERSLGGKGGKLILLTPFVAFGRPVISRVGVSTQVIAERVNAGEERAAIIRDYNPTADTCSCTRGGFHRWRS